MPRLQLRGQLQFGHRQDRRELRRVGRPRRRSLQPNQVSELTGERLGRGRLEQRDVQLERVPVATLVPGLELQAHRPAARAHRHANLEAQSCDPLGRSEEPQHVGPLDREVELEARLAIERSASRRRRLVLVEQEPARERQAPIEGQRTPSPGRGRVDDPYRQPLEPRGQKPLEPGGQVLGRARDPLRLRGGRVPQRGRVFSWSVGHGRCLVLHISAPPRDIHRRHRATSNAPERRLTRHRTPRSSQRSQPRDTRIG